MPTIPFPPAANNIPIVGQPFALKSWFPTVLITCQCIPHGEPVLIVGTTPALCPRCQRGYVVGTVQFDLSTGSLKIGIGLVRQPEPIGVPS